jgi:hypothetical protein
MLAEGRPAAGRVLSSRRFGEHGYRIEIEFRLLNGATRTVKITSQKKYTAGTAITILYNPDHPRSVAVYPLPLVQLLK